MSENGAKPNILLFCATGRGLGMGHLYRCRMLLRELAGPQSLISARPDPDAARFLDFPPVPWQAVEPHLADGSLGLRLAEIAGESGANVVVLDCKDTSRALVQTLRQCGLAVVTLEDLGPGREEANLLLDPHIQPGSPEATYAGRAECCFGPGWALLDPTFAGLGNAAAARISNDEPLTVAVSLGGGDPAGLTGRVLEALSGIEPALNIEVALGPTAQADDLPSAGKHALRIHRNLPSLAGLLNRSDIAFTGGGITMFESLCLGVPTVVVPQHGEQHRNASRLEQRGALLLASEQSVPYAPKELKEITAEICGSIELRNRLSVTGKSLVDGAAVKRLAEKITALTTKSEHGKLAPARR